MKALTLAEFGRMEIVDLSESVPGPGEVQIEVVATGICGSDLHGFTGENGRRVPGQIMGHESVGRVSAVGPNVNGTDLGQVVTFNPVIVPDEEVDLFHGREQMSPNKKVIGVAPEITSSFAQKICVPERNVVALPEEMPIELGALIEPLAVAVHAVRRSGAEASDTLLILGGGPIGQSVVLAAQMAGLSNIVVTENIESRRRLVHSLGATVFDATAEDVLDQILDTVGAVDVAIDAVGIEPTMRLALQATSLGATICLVGMGTPQILLDAFRISTEERSLTGSFTYTAQDFADAATWMGTAPTQAEHLITRQVSIEDGPEQFVALAAGEDTPGKVLIRLDKETKMS